MPKVKKEIPPESGVTLSAAQLARMTTHELADMLSNVVLLLRRMPDVPCEALVAREASTAQTPIIPTIPITTATETPHEQNTTLPQIGLMEPVGLMGLVGLQERIAELEGKKYTIPKLQAMADELGIPYPTKPKKADLAKRIAERQMRGHSEQYAMMNL